MWLREFLDCPPYFIRDGGLSGVVNLDISRLVLSAMKKKVGCAAG